jgi:hypothetical protein
MNEKMAPAATEKRKTCVSSRERGGNEITTF